MSSRSFPRLEWAYHAATHQLGYAQGLHSVYIHRQYSKICLCVCFYYFASLRLLLLSAKAVCQNYVLCARFLGVFVLCVHGVCVWVLERVSITGKQLSIRFGWEEWVFFLGSLLTGYENNLTLPIPIA